MAIDPRIMQVNIQIGDREIIYNDLAISATGTKFSNANQGNAIITIANVDNDVRDFILTEGTPFLRDRQQARKRISVFSGRVSTGLSLVHTGNIFRATISNPPDQIISIRSIQQQAAKGNIIQNNFAGMVPLRTIAEQISSDIELANDPVIEADDINIADYSFSGSATEQIKKLNELINISAWIDNDTLYITNTNTPLTQFSRTITPRNGMVGIPQPTEQGIKVKMMYDNRVVTGSQLTVESERYPSLSGQYLIYKLSYTLTNRDVPFYLQAEGTRIR